MSRGPVPSPFSDGDLNGLVDGQIDAGRQAELLHRLKAYPLERERVEAWREQNDLIRATFCDVENEPVPVSLSLAPPSRLRCVTSDGRTTAFEPGSGLAKASLKTSKGRTGASSGVAAASRRRSRFWVGVFAGLAGLGGAWTLVGHSSESGTVIPLRPVAQAEAKPLDARALEARPREAIPIEAVFNKDDALDRRPRAADETLLTARTLEAFARPLSGERNNGADHRAALDLPITSIPNLGAAGFGFAGAARSPADPTLLVFFYENDAAERVALGVTSAAIRLAPAADRTSSVTASTWQRHGRTFALVGTLERQRLGALAELLQAAE